MPMLYLDWIKTLETLLPRILIRWIAMVLKLFKKRIHIFLFFYKGGGVKEPYVLINGILCYKDKDKIVPAVPIGLTPKVLKHARNNDIGGYFGVEKTLHRIKDIGWWSYKN